MALIDPASWPNLLAPLAAAEDALARLDERLKKSPIKDGFIERTHFADALASLWLDGERVDLEDLVLHDAGMDIRTPTHELTRAHHILRLRRRIFANTPAWALTDSGLAALRGKPTASEFSGPPGAAILDPPAEDDPFALDDRKLANTLAAADAALRRANAHLARPRSVEANSLVYDSDWDEDARLARWRETLAESTALPPTLAAALALQAWDAIEPLQHMAWLGRLLAAAQLRARGKTAAHLCCLNTGLRTLPFEKRRTRTRTQRLIVTLEALKSGAEMGLAEHERWVNARAALERKIATHRAHSHLPDLVELVMRRPLVSARMIAHELKITTRAAQNLVAALGLREATGRTHYRAWGVL